MAMDPLPEEFVCVEPLFKRRLRMRQAAAPKETKAEIAQQRAKAGEVSSRLQQKTVVGWGSLSLRHTHMVYRFFFSVDFHTFP